MAENDPVANAGVEPEPLPGKFKPVVVKTGKKKKRRYSKGLGMLQRTNRPLVKSAQRIARAVEKGITTYRRRSKRSALKKRDGALRDFIPNAGIAMSRVARKASLAPSDLAQAIHIKSRRRRLKRHLRILSYVLRS